MKNILGIDLGTNSIGWSIREINSTNDQIAHKGVLTFEKGVGEDQGKEVPLVQKRTESRSKRRNYQAKKYRKWALLETLILQEPKMCPLNLEELNAWRKYVKGQDRVYPQSTSFKDWLKLDFNGDGKVDFDNPFQLRMIVSQIKIDNPYIIGRVFYHMVQRRGFRGRDEEESKTILEGSKEKSTIGANEVQKIMVEEKTTLGGALHLIQQKQNKRIRNRYNLRSDIEAEIQTICAIQGIDENSALFHSLIKSIIWQRPLRTQKGNVGRCSLEPSKSRCPLSHPLYEEYRAWCFINNIKVKNKETIDSKFESLNDEQKTLIYQKVFFGKKKNKEHFDFSEIIKLLDKKGNNLEFNYKPFVSVSGCPVTFQLEEIFECKLEEIKVGHSSDPNKPTSKSYYDYNDLWHILFSFDSKEKLEIFAKEKLGLDDEKARSFSKIKIYSGYASLSLNAIKKILPYLYKGFIYTEAIYLANLSKVLNTNLDDDEIIKITEGIRNQMGLYKQIREELSITNGLIGDYLNLPPEEQHGRYLGYALLDKDKNTVEQKMIEHFGNKRWEEIDSGSKSQIQRSIEQKYEVFLQTPRSTELKLLYNKLPRLDELIKSYLKKDWHVEETNLSYLYHPSETEFYPPAKENEGKKYLGSPEPISRGFKNPMALKTLHHLKHLINYLLTQGRIDEETRVVVEIARELNDANKRKAIERYQREREKQNKEFAEAINEFIEKEKLTIEITDEIIDKYRLWLEQGRQCIYTSNVISITELFAGTQFDLEHTIPSDISFDNELKNLTIADSIYNRQIKQKKIPTELPNYKRDIEIEGVLYTAIEPRLKFLEEKVEHFKKQVEFWKKEAKKASTKDRKDYSIQQRHYNQFELDYWFKKFNTFTIKEYKPQWRNSQLRDTQIITKYALHYLKTVFNKVEVQKGNVVAEFRKIFNVSFEKDRTKHTHHAIDAAVLTLIPPPTIREKMLQEHFSAIEREVRFHTVPSGWPNFNPSTILKIENETLINHITQDRTLVPAKKFVRKRGKIQFVKEYLDDGKWQYKLDQNSKRIPLIAQGDSIRGQLHKETFYGAIKENSNEDVVYVVRKMLKDFKSEKEFEDIVDPIVKKVISETITERIQNGKLFKEALSEAIFMVDNNGNPKKTDKNEKKLLPIRHVRCKARAGRGYLSKALPLKEHIFKSEQEHKQLYYVQNELNYLFLLYEFNAGEKVLRTHQIINLLDLVSLSIKNPNELYNTSYHTIEKKKGKEKLIYELKQILKVGQKVLLWNEFPEELEDLSSKDLLKRLYRIYKFNEISGTSQIYLKYHNEARPDLDLPNDDKIFEPLKYQPTITLTASKFNCLIEGRDFYITLDGIIYLKR